MSVFGSRAFAILLAAAALPALCHPATAADVKRIAPPVAVTVPEPTGSELVGKLLSEQNGPSNPDVPLPQHSLSLRQDPASTPLGGPQIYGRREEGGGVFGLKIPIQVRAGTN